MNKKIINGLILLFPFIDLLTALLTRNYNIGITPGLIIKGLFMIFFLFYIFFSHSKYKKESIIIITLYFVYLILYFVSKPDIINFKYLANEITYLFKLFYFPIVFLGMVNYYSDNNFDKYKIIKILKINIISITFLLLIPLLFGTAFKTYTMDLKGYIGWFFAGNEVANIIVILFPFTYLYFNENKYSFLIYLPIMYSMLMIGTKVAFLGLIIIAVISTLYSFIKNNNYKYKCLICLILTILLSLNCYAVQNYKTLTKSPNPEKQIIIDNIHKKEVNKISKNLDRFYNKNKFNLIFKTLLSGRDGYLANTISIYNDDINIKEILFGIGFSNTPKIDNSNITKLIEIDLLDAYFHIGIFGLLIMISPLLITLVYIIKSRQRININSSYLILIVLLMCGISCLSGHTFMAPAVSIYLTLYLLLILNEFKIFDKKLFDKVAILSLHMGYGGIEKSIIDQANMISNFKETEIICLYKLDNKLPYDKNSKVKLIYLSNLKPNKKEFLEAFNNKKIINIIKEGFKSIKILYLKKYLVSDYITNSDAKIIISTRLEFTKYLNNYGNQNAIKIAEEHVYHHNDIKYINKLKRNLTNINYLIPGSNYLTADYKKYFKNQKVKIVYIPQIINYYPKNANKCNNLNIISVGRLSKEKGFIDLIEVMDLVTKQNNKIKLTIAGDGPERKNIEKLIKNYNLKTNIILKGFLNQGDLKKEYSKASLYVMPSHEEAFGLVLIEAMSYGLPCFAFDSALGAKELINKNNGLLIKNRNIEDMAKAIINYFENDNKYDSRKTAIKYYEPEVTKIWGKFIGDIDDKN